MRASHGVRVTRAAVALVILAAVRRAVAKAHGGVVARHHRARAVGATRVDTIRLQQDTTISAHVVAHAVLAPPPTQRYFTGAVVEGVSGEPIYIYIYIYDI